MTKGLNHGKIDHIMVIDGTSFIKCEKVRLWMKKY